MSLPIDPPRLGVVTVSFGSDGVLESFLDSIEAASDEPVTVVIADNRPSPVIRRVAAERGAAYLPLPSNPGYGAAINAAIHVLPDQVEWVLIANPDVVLGHSSITVLLRSGDSDDRIGSVGPAVRDESGAIYPSARRIPSLRTGIGHALLAGIWPTNPWTRAYREESSPFRREAGWLSGACLLVRRSAFDAIGGFDPAYFMYFEDVDLGYRLGRDGWLNVYEPGASITHTGAHSTRDDSAAMVRAHHRSAARFVRLKYGAPILLPVRVAVSIGLRLRSWIVLRGLR